MRPTCGRFLPAQFGFSLVELMTWLTVSSLAVGIVLPNAIDATWRWRLRAATRDLAMRVRAIRLEAVLNQRAIGIVFDAEDGYRYTIVQDGNGNGIRLADVRAGVDRPVAPRRSLADDYRGVTVAILAPDPIPNIPPGRGPLSGRADPIKVGGRSDIMSCTPAGTCTSGTIYLSAGTDRMAAVKVKGWNAQVQTWEFDRSARRWVRWAR